MLYSTSGCFALLLTTVATCLERSPGDLAGVVRLLRVEMRRPATGAVAAVQQDLPAAEPVTVRRLVHHELVVVVVENLRKLRVGVPRNPACHRKSSTTTTLLFLQGIITFTRPFSVPACWPYGYLSPFCCLAFSWLGNPPRGTTIQHARNRREKPFFGTDRDLECEKRRTWGVMSQTAPSPRPTWASPDFSWVQVGRQPWLPRQVRSSHLLPTQFTCPPKPLFFRGCQNLFDIKEPFKFHCVFRTPEAQIPAAATLRHRSNPLVFLKVFPECKLRASEQRLSNALLFCGLLDLKIANKFEHIFREGVRKSAQRRYLTAVCKGSQKVVARGQKGPENLQNPHSAFI